VWVLSHVILNGGSFQGIALGTVGLRRLRGREREIGDSIPHHSC
jgi:hypothetical protein